MVDPKGASESNAELAAGGLNPEAASVSPMPGEDGKRALKADSAAKRGEAAHDQLAQQSPQSPRG